MSHGLISPQPNHASKPRVQGTDYPNSPKTGLPVVNDGRERPVFLLRSGIPAPKAWRMVAWRPCGLGGVGTD